MKYSLNKCQKGLFHWFTTGQIYFGGKKKKVLSLFWYPKKAKQVEENQVRRDMTEVVDRKSYMKPPFI